jgi:hypothetical protein
MLFLLLTIAVLLALGAAGMLGHWLGESAARERCARSAREAAAEDWKAIDQLIRKARGAEGFAALDHLGRIRREVRRRFGHTRKLVHGLDAKVGAATTFLDDVPAKPAHPPAAHPPAGAAPAAPPAASAASAVAVVLGDTHYHASLFDPPGPHGHNGGLKEERARLLMALEELASYWADRKARIEEIMAAQSELSTVVPAPKPPKDHHH